MRFDPAPYSFRIMNGWKAGNISSQELCDVANCQKSDSKYTHKYTAMPSPVLSPVVWLHYACIVNPLYIITCTITCSVITSGIYYLWFNIVNPLYIITLLSLVVWLHYACIVNPLLYITCSVTFAPAMNFRIAVVVKYFVVIVFDIKSTHEIGPCCLRSCQKVYRYNHGIDSTTPANVHVSIFAVNVIVNWKK